MYTNRATRSHTHSCATYRRMDMCRMCARTSPSRRARARALHQHKMYARNYNMRMSHSGRHPRTAFLSVLFLCATPSPSTTERLTTRSRVCMRMDMCSAESKIVLKNRSSEPAQSTESGATEIPPPNNVYRLAWLSGTIETNDDTLRCVFLGLRLCFSSSSFFVSVPQLCHNLISSSIVAVLSFLRRDSFQSWSPVPAQSTLICMPKRRRVAVATSRHKTNPRRQKNDKIALHHTHRSAIPS